jgi:hypothetical protein
MRAGNIVRGWRAVPVRHRPRKLDVRRRNKAMGTFILALTQSLPYAAFTVAGALMWKRRHSVAAALVAVGFSATLLGEFAVNLRDAQIISALRANQPGSAAPIHFDVLVGTPLAEDVAHLGIWVAALGLIWYACRRDASACLNQRLERP